jgi:hypothetical protein
MSNPATLLYETLARWRPSNSYADPTEQRIAIRHLDAIAELLNQMDGAGHKTHFYRRYYDHWVTLTLHHPHEWQRGAGSQHIDNSALENLELLADRLDSLVPVIQDGGLDQLRAYAQEANDIIDADGDVPPMLKMHVKQVITHVFWCINNFDAVGEFDLQDAIQRLLGAMMTAAKTADMSGPMKDRWKTWLNGLVFPFSVNVMSAVPAQALVQLMLGAGS